MPHHPGIQTLLLTLVVGNLSCAHTPAVTDFDYQNEVRLYLVEGQRQLERALASEANSVPFGDPLFTQLATAESSAFEVELAENQALAVLAVCDRDCRDLDMRVLGPNGQLVEWDEQKDDAPFVLLMPEVAGTYTIDLTMHSCERSSCHAGIQGFELAHGDVEQFRAQVFSQLGELRGLARLVGDEINRKVEVLTEERLWMLRQGEVRQEAVTLPDGEYFMVFAASDADSRRISLTLLDRLARPVSDDRILRSENDNGGAYLLFSPSEAGDHYVRLGLEECSADACVAGWQLIRFVPEAQHPASPAAETNGESIGTCFAAGPSGQLITANHVIESASRLQVRTANGSEYEAKVLALSQSTDIALLQIPARTPQYLPIKSTTANLVGARVFTLGFPVPDWLGPGPRFSDGTVSALAGLGGDSAFMQVSVPLQPGNSGGPIVSEEGFVVGVVSHGVNSIEYMKKVGTLPQGLNFATRSEFAHSLIQAAPLPPVSSLREAISRVERAICRVRAW